MTHTLYDNKELSATSSSIVGTDRTIRATHKVYITSVLPAKISVTFKAGMCSRSVANFRVNVMRSKGFSCSPLQILQSKKAILNTYMYV